MRASRLPWSWTAWLATGPVIGVTAYAGMTVATSVQYNAALHTLLGPRPILTEALFALQIGVFGAFWLILPLVAAKLMKRSAELFLLFAVLFPAVGWVLEKWRGFPLIDGLPLEYWLDLLVTAFSQFAGALTYIMVTWAGAHRRNKRELVL